MRIDRAGVQIWFQLSRFSRSKRRRSQRTKFVIRAIELKNQIDRSHHFLYGHRYQQDVKGTQSLPAPRAFNGENADLAGGDSKQIAKIGRRQTKMTRRSRRIHGGRAARSGQFGSLPEKNAEENFISTAHIKRSPDKELFWLKGRRRFAKEFSAFWLIDKEVDRHLGRK